MTVDLTFFQVSDTKREVAKLGRRMMQYSEEFKDSDTPVEILNAFSRVGENLAENASDKMSLSDLDKMVVKYARKVL